MRKSILLLFAFVAVSTTAFAQEDGSSRAFNFYVDGNTGQLNGSEDDGDLFSGYWACAGLSYEHGFANGFGFYVGAVVFDNGVTSKNVLSYVSANAGVSYGIGGFSSYVQLNTDYVIEGGVAYGHSLGSAGSVKVGAWACFSPFNLGDDWYYNGKDYVGGEYSVLDFFEAYVQYSIGFAENWAFTTKPRFRFSDDSSAEAFGESFVFRWDNTVSYDVSDNLGVYAQLRYQALGIASDGDVSHALSVGAGLSYSYDLQ